MNAVRCRSSSKVHLQRGARGLQHATLDRLPAELDVRFEAMTPAEAVPDVRDRFHEPLHLLLVVRARLPERSSDLIYPNRLVRSPRLELRLVRGHRERALRAAVALPRGGRGDADDDSVDGDGRERARHRRRARRD
eukprot:31157-Pelagococcus_subviridis.AAC.19